MFKGPHSQETKLRISEAVKEYWGTGDASRDMYRDKDWLETQYVDLGLSTINIARDCSVSSTTIQYWLEKFSIPRRTTSEAMRLNSNHIELSNEALEFLEGGIVGDGCLEECVKGYSAHYRQTSKHLEYIQWLIKEFLRFGIETVGKIQSRLHPSGKWSYALDSRTYVEFGALYLKWYPKGGKIIPTDFRYTPSVLRQHYLDDGCLHNGRTIELYTNAFSLPDVTRLVNNLKDLSFNPRIDNHGRGNFIRLLKKDIRPFLDYIGSCPVKCFQYKWGIEY